MARLLHLGTSSHKGNLTLKTNMVTVGLLDAVHGARLLTLSIVSITSLTEDVKVRVVIRSRQGLIQPGVWTESQMTHGADSVGTSAFHYEIPSQQGHWESPSGTTWNCNGGQRLSRSGSHV